MSRKRKMTKPQEQVLVSDILAAMPKAGIEPTVLGLLQFGSSELLKAAIAEEITEYLGRCRYAHRSTGQPFKGYRNGSRQGTKDTPIGQVHYDRPLVVHAPDFESKYHGRHMRRPKEFADAVAEMHVSGVSTRNVKRALKSVTGKKVKLSRSTVSRITKRLREEFLQWQKRDLSHLNVAYLFLDAIKIGMRLQNTHKQSVLMAYAVLTDGSHELLSVGVVNAESNDSWKSFVVELKRRGLKDPLLVISDGNPGVINAIENNLPTAWRQRCVRHRIENILVKVPKEEHDKMRKYLNRVFYGATSLEQAKIAMADFKLRFTRLYPSAMACFEEDLSQCLTYYLFPQSHWKRLRTSSCLDRVHAEIKRRLRTIGRHPDETGCLAMVYHLSIRYSKNKYGFKANDMVEALWRKLREEKINMNKQLELDLEVA